MQTHLPNRAIALISEYSKPISRSDWRTGSRVHQIASDTPFGATLLFETMLYDKIVQYIMQYNNFDAFQCDYMPSLWIDVIKPQNCTLKKAHYLADQLVIKALKLEDF